MIKVIKETKTLDGDDSDDNGDENFLQDSLASSAVLPAPQVPFLWRDVNILLLKQREHWKRLSLIDNLHPLGQSSNYLKNSSIQHWSVGSVSNSS